MKTFLVGRKVRILHPPDFRGKALLAYNDEEFPIPAAAAKEIIDALRKAQRLDTEPPEKDGD